MKTTTVLIVAAILIGFYFLILAVNKGAGAVADKIPSFDLSSKFGETLAAANAAIFGDPVSSKGLNDLGDDGAMYGPMDLSSAQ